MVDDEFSQLLRAIRTCTQCTGSLPHEPRPVVQASAAARVLIIGQAPGSKVHASGIPWDDDSGDRLRDWTGLERGDFYDPAQIALMPMGFCYPGKGSGGDLPPRPECAPLWHDRLRAGLPAVRLTLLVGQYAIARYVATPPKPSLTAAVRNQLPAPGNPIALPHPAWRSTLWMRQNPWFEAELLPVLKARIAEALAD